MNATECPRCGETILYNPDGDIIQCDECGEIIYLPDEEDFTGDDDLDI